ETRGRTLPCRRGAGSGVTLAERVLDGGPVAAGLGRGRRFVAALRHVDRLALGVDRRVVPGALVRALAEHVGEVLLVEDLLLEERLRELLQKVAFLFEEAARLLVHLVDERLHLLVNE